VRNSTQAPGRLGRVLPALLAGALLAAPAAQARPDSDDPGNPSVRPPAQEVNVVTAGDGFDWADAGIGAGVAAGMALLAAAAAGALTRRRHMPTAN
jgi:hypothetical protein